MKIEDSVLIKNRISVLSVLMAVVVYAVLAAFTFGIALLVLLPCAAIAFFLSGKEIARAKATANVFKTTYPLHYFGTSYGDFEHVFFFDQNLGSELVKIVIRELRKKTAVQSIDPMTITDIDDALRSQESRVFLRADAGQTQRGTTITLVLQMTSFGGMQSVHWWVLAGGYVDRDKRFRFAAYAPLSLWFWIVPYLRKKYDILDGIRTVHPGAYNAMDIATRVRCIHEAVFGAIVSGLENHGIDTSDLRVQRGQVMNISVSGGKFNVGSLVQGAKNKIAGSVGTSFGPAS